MMFTYHTKMHVGVVMTPAMQAAFYAVVLPGDVRPLDLVNDVRPERQSLAAVRLRHLVDDHGITDLGRRWIVAERDAAHASTLP
jgi:hypothetical protein